MSSLLRRLESRGRFADGTHNLSALTSPKLAASILVSLCTFGVLLALFSFSSSDRDDGLQDLADLQTVNSSGAPGAPGKGRFHFLIPATSSYSELCKLLVSAQILDYPTPVLINWGLAADPNGDSNTHLAKIQGFVDYLDDLESSSESFDEDLVLIVDGYDV